MQKTISRMLIIVFVILAALCVPASAAVSYGSTNDDVLKLQNRLSELGYFIGECNGFFGDRTQTAVSNFQKANGLEPTGIVDAQTNAKMDSDTAVTKQEYILKTRKVTVIDYTLMPGDSGDKVKRLQSLLFALGYFSDEITGNYRSVTEYSVSVFQLVNKLPVTGIADSETLTKLTSHDVIGADAFKDSFVLEVGDVGSDVKSLQTELKKLGYFKGDCSGKFGSNTQQAVVEFQKCNGLEQTGKCEIPMRIMLIKGSAISSAEAAAMEAISAVYKGDNSEHVITIKEQLSSLGYYAGTIDREYTHELSEAVYYFQLANGLQTNGDADNATRLLLNSGLGKTYKAYREELKKTPADFDDAGLHVVMLQERLNALGYYSGAMTGKYDAATGEAVKIFQRGHMLEETSIADADTCALIYSDQALSYSVAQKQYYARKAEEKRLQTIESICSQALGCVALPYEAGKVGPEKYGSAGLVYAIFKNANVSLQPTVTLQYEAAASLEEWNEDPAKLDRGHQLFLKKNGEMFTGIYVGNNLFVYASLEFGQVVAVENILETGEYEFVGSVAYL